MTPITIDTTTKKTCFNFAGRCGGAAEPEGEMIIKIKLAGTCTWLIEYPGVADEECGVCFVWGELMWGLAPGRYVGDIFDGKTLIDSVQFQLHPQDWVVTPCVADSGEEEDEEKCTC